MASQIDLEPASWPSVPLSDRPRKLYVTQNLSPEAEFAFSEKGWELIDVRLLPYNTDQERDAAIKATLAGLRVGSIPTRQGLKDYLELEAKTCGTIGSKEPAKPQDQVLDKMTLHQVLENFGSARAGMGVSVEGSEKVVEAPAPSKRKRKTQTEPT